MGRAEDLTWRDLVAAAERLSRSSADTVAVSASRLGVLRVTECLEAGDLWVHVEPEQVRWRWRLSARWHPIQSVEEAARKVELFMRERPDLGSST